MRADETVLRIASTEFDIQRDARGHYFARCRPCRNLRATWETPALDVAALIDVCEHHVSRAHPMGLFGTIAAGKETGCRD